MIYKAFLVYSQHPAWVITPVNPEKVWSIAYKQFYQQRHRNNDYSKTRTVLSDPRITDLADRHGHLPKMVPQLLALINLPLCEAGFSDKQALSVNPLTALVSCATEFTST